MDLSLQGVIDSLGDRAGAAFAVEMPGGIRYRTGVGEPVFTVVFRTERALAATFLRGHLGLLEAYFDQEVDVQGDFAAAMAAGMNSGFDLRFDAVNSVENNLLEWRNANRSPAQAKANARAHYGLGEPFYRLWLDDPLKMNTCGYWRTTRWLSWRSNAIAWARRRSARSPWRATASAPAAQHRQQCERAL